MLKESTRPPPTTEAFRMSRREAPPLARIGSSRVMALGLHWLAGGLLDGRADARVGGAAADVGHGRVDVGVGGLWLGRQERRRGHDLARLAIAALGDVELHPGGLHLLADRV